MWLTSLSDEVGRHFSKAVVLFIHKFIHVKKNKKRMSFGKMALVFRDRGMECEILPNLALDPTLKNVKTWHLPSGVPDASPSAAWPVSPMRP